MTTPCFCLDYRFHPVGQGLFSSGSFYRSNKPSCNFLWVYDCGTASSQKLIDHGINNLQTHAGYRRKIDILTISHFDRDHISGVAKLLAKFHVDMLLLPFIPLWQRLLFAFEEGIGPNDPELEFFLNPVTYLGNLDGRINRIVFVPASGTQGPPIQDQNPNDPLPSLDDLTLEADYEDPESLGAEQDSLEGPKGGINEVRVLRKDSAITLSSLWEFVPYNDASQAPKSPTLEAQVSTNRDALLSAPTIAGRVRILALLKSIYDKSFGKSAKYRNLISLFLYGGPLYLTYRATGLVDTTFTHPRPWPYPMRYPCFFRVRDCAPMLSEKCSILYSGDGYLDTKDRLDRLITHLSTTRIEKIGIFQVMHHGAKTNWHSGVARAINPKISVFSSDPKRRGLRHPHKVVKRDFSAHCPVQIDKTHGAVFPGWLLPK